MEGMEGEVAKRNLYEAAKRNLYEAATMGEVARFIQLLEEDPYLVDEVSFSCSRNLLHIATMHAQAGIVEEVLKTSPQLARDVDSKMWSSLHIAAAQGSLKIARKLLSVAPEMCWWRDGQGMNPVHIAAINGHVHILLELLRLDSFPAMERLHRGQTVLHLCVKYHKFEALKVLVEMLGELVCAKDDDGETLLHLAVRCNQLEIIRYLVGSNKIKMQTPNSMGKTALDLLNESSSSSSSSDTTQNSDMERILISLTDKSLLEVLPKVTDITMVVVVLIATMAFQAAVSPPGGVWQDNTSSHRAGEAVMASTHPKVFKHFVRSNTIAFISALVTIFLLTTGLPSGRLRFMTGAIYVMWVSLTAIAVSYGASTIVITTSDEDSFAHFVLMVIVVTLSISGLIGTCLYIINWGAVEDQTKRSNNRFSNTVGA